MGGNQNKWAWNKRHTGAHHNLQSNRDGISNQVAIAVELEEAAWAVKHINARVKRERHDSAVEKRMRETRRKITLPTIESLNKFMGR